VKRRLVAADVIERKELQEEFNAYLAKHGQDVHIDCGDGVIAPHHKEMITGAYAGGIKQAYDLFRAAYEAKGRLPESRDPSPTAAERAAFIVRNDSHFPASKDAHQKWGRFPVKSAPWPTMTCSRQRGAARAEEIWQRFALEAKRSPTANTLGELLSRQTFAAPASRSIPIHYSTFQMMMKDGGVWHNGQYGRPNRNRFGNPGMHC
jgi:hypothetical protein